MKGLLVNERTIQGRLLVVICEEELVGKRLSDGYFVDPAYYQGEPVQLESAMVAARRGDLVTLLGSRVVKAAVARGLVDKDAVTSIGGVSYAEVYRV